jgi:tetratricopeptide (TPR) repeat protein
VSSGPATEPHEQYSREAVRRVLGVSEKRLKSWERAGLIQYADAFSFKDLIALRALHLNPAYADAHFNLALVAERKNNALRAVKHWTAYLKLDPNSTWAAQARKQLEQLRRLTVVE